jgi:hypothetical protein
MIIIYIKHALMAYIEDASQLLRHGRFLSIVIQNHMVATMEHLAPMQRFGKVDSIGLPCMKTPSLLFDDAQDATSTGILMQEMQCL